MKTKDLLYALAVTAMFLTVSCSNNNKKQEVTKEQKSSENFDINNPDKWPVKFSDYGFTAKTYPEAESYTFMGNFIKRSGINNFFHFKTLSKKEDHWVVSPNNDVLYSLVTVDASDDFTLIIPESKYDDRIISIQIVDADHFTPVQFYGAGTYTYPKGTFNTPIVVIGVRVEVNAHDPKELDYVANVMQPKMKVIAKSNTAKVPEIDTDNMQKLRKALMPYYDKLPNTFGGMTQNASQVKNLWYREVVTAGAWGLSEDKYAMYVIYAPGLDASKAYTATYQVPPQDGFWSFTMYDADKYLVSNDANILNRFNTVFNDDGTFTVCFGSKEQCGDAPNRLDIVDGWNFLVRAYKPKVEEFKKYKLPEVKPYSKK